MSSSPRPTHPPQPHRPRRSGVALRGHRRRLRDRPGHHRPARHRRHRPRGLLQRPAAALRHLLHGRRLPLDRGRLPLRPAGARTGSGASPTGARSSTARRMRRRLRDFRAGVLMQTLLRDGAAGLMHSLIYFPFLVLFAVTMVLEINHQMPESLKFLHGDVYQAHALVADVAGVLFLVGIVWALVRRYIQRPVPHPHQDPARGRGHPRHLPAHRRHRLPRRGPAHRHGRTGPTSSSGRSSATPLSNAVRRRRAHRRRGTRCSGSCTSSASCLLLDPAAHHEAAPHVHLAAEHVPARPRPAQGRHEAAAQPDGDRARDASAPTPSRTSPGSSCSTPTRAPCAAAARACARPTPPASPSTPARSCSRSAT